VCGIYARILHDGCPDYNPAYAEYWESLLGTSGRLQPHSVFLHKWAKEAIDTGTVLMQEAQQAEKETAKKYVPTIQERIRDQAYAACHAIDDWLETVVESKTEFDFTNHFAQTGITQAHARKIRELYLGEYEEYNQIVNHMPTPQQIAKISDETEKDLAMQFREGYTHLKKADTKAYLAALEKLIGACDVIMEKAKTTRKPRVRKAPSKEKLVGKVKYKKQDDKYQIVSVNPVDMIDAKEIWVFNTKSIQKTLRKPEQQLKEFKSAGKVALRKFMDGITTTDTKLNGRLNADTVILRVS